MPTEITGIQSWLTTGQTAHELRLSAMQTRRLAKAGYLRYVETQAGYLFDPHSVSEYKRERQTGVTK